MPIEMLTIVDTSVDNLHRTRERIKALQEEEKALKEEIIATCQAEITGTTCKAVVSYVPETETTDYKAVVGFVKVAKNILDRFKKPKAGYFIINIRPL
jgi:hypothetical protein